MLVRVVQFYYLSMNFLLHNCSQFLQKLSHHCTLGINVVLKVLDYSKSSKHQSASILETVLEDNRYYFVEAGPASPKSSTDISPHLFVPVEGLLYRSIQGFL